MNNVPDSHQDILETKGTAFLATIGPKGAPNVTPTWYLWDPDARQLLISTTAGRQKSLNLKRDPRLAVCIADPENPHRYVEMRGPAKTVKPDEGHRVVNALARKYMGLDEFPREMMGEGRVVIRIDPQRVICYGAAKAR